MPQGGPVYWAGMNVRPRWPLLMVAITAAATAVIKLVFF